MHDDLDVALPNWQIRHTRIHSSTLIRCLVRLIADSSMDETKLKIARKSEDEDVVPSYQTRRGVDRG